jgi:translation initiation factor eIF-2B subunit delta
MEYKGKKQKEMTKAERRALQEAQRAAKAAAKGVEKGSQSKKGKDLPDEKSALKSPVSAPASAVMGAVAGPTSGAPAPRLQFDDSKKMAKHAKKQQLHRTRLQKEVALFSHLPQYERETSLSLHVGFLSEEIHPSVLRLGLKFSEGVFQGSNSRCIAMLTAFEDFIRDYSLPENQTVNRDLPKKLQPQIRFLIDCRPSSITMGNAITFLKMKISDLPPEITESEAKELLVDSIRSYIQERIIFSDKIITKSAIARIVDGDTILVYGRSHVVEMILLKAFARGKSFKVVVIDSRPKFEGRALVKRLVSAGIKCTYSLVVAVPYVMREVTKVFLGTYGMLANGAGISRVGSAVVAMHAHHKNIPVIFCCETYKFYHGAQVDAITFNEIGNGLL